VRDFVSIRACPVSSRAIARMISGERLSRNAPSVRSGALGRAADRGHADKAGRAGIGHKALSLANEQAFGIQENGGHRCGYDLIRLTVFEMTFASVPTLTCGPCGPVDREGARPASSRTRRLISGFCLSSASRTGIEA
jgi:hypothetical protein